MNLDPRLLTAFKLSVAIAGAVWGGIAASIQVLLVVMILDVATGFLAAYVTQTLSSDVSRRGMAKKAIVLILVALAAALEQPSGIHFLKDAAAYFFVAHEGLSITENAARAGLPVPKFLTDALAKLNPDKTITTA